MLLLYCRDNVVIATHEDTQDVPAAAYGAGTRIIPLPVGTTLGRVGAPPPLPKMPDVRPYALPAVTPDLLRSYAAQQRYETSRGGLMFESTTVGSIPVRTDPGSQTSLGNLVQFATMSKPETILSFTQSGVAWSITAAEAIELFEAVGRHVQQCHAVEAACIADIGAGAIASYDAVDERFAELRAANLVIDVTVFMVGDGGQPIAPGRPGISEVW